jgi:ATP-dependent helicase/nuclease subunit A
MSASGARMTSERPSDEPARDAIRTALDTTMLVEAGAGSGKTTLMVDRLVAYAARGTDVDQLAAVTFTRKAANELRQRFETRLEVETRNPQRSAAERARLTTALGQRERMFIGTVHAFCGRVLREHALEAGLPLDFTELDEIETAALRTTAWHEFLERGSAHIPLDALASLGIDAFSLGSAFAEYEQYRDLAFPAPHAPRPSHVPVRDRLLALIAQAFALRDAAGTTRRDALQSTMERLWRGYTSHAFWKDAPAFAADAETLLTASRRKVVQKHWGDSREQKAAAKALGEAIETFVDSELAPWYERWWAHAYPVVLDVFKAASDAALAGRRRNGLLGFDDLLTETARLLRENPDARRVLGARWRHLLVDEFQDTDPVQAEVCFLLASDPDEGNDWRTVSLRGGSLFVVGDPKQSIYRFRRADLATYRLVESRIAQCGRVERLTRNFRSVPAIGALVNEHFRSVFVSTENAPASAHQASFAEFIAATARTVAPTAGVAHYWAGPPTKARNEDIVGEDAARVASWIAYRCNVTCDRKPQDFLVLTSNRHVLARYAHELALRNIPLTASGASNTVDRVIGELLVILRALADPSNAVAVIAALEGWCAGCSHADLWEARQRAVTLHLTRPPLETASAVGAGLVQLHLWWFLSKTLAPASLLEHILDASGLFLLAASDDLGDRNGGLLLQLVAMLRGAAGTGSDLSSAITAIEAALVSGDGDPALRVGRGDVVRLMNLHKAKGLEAKVVVLAAPVEPPEHEVTLATWRDATGAPAAAMIVSDDRGRIVAKSASWSARHDEEIARQQAERDRLLYVAVTRAEDELVIARRTPFMVANKARGDTSAWSSLAPVLDAQSTALELPIVAPPGRRTLEVSANEMRRRVAHATSSLQASATRSYLLLSITEAAKRSAAAAEADGAPLLRASDEADDKANDDVDEPRAPTLFAPPTLLDLFAPPEPLALPALPTDRVPGLARRSDGALAFGSLVHQAIEGALRGRDDEGLVAYVRALAWHQTPLLAPGERELLVTRVLDVVSEARGTDAWRAIVTHRGLAELPVATVLADISAHSVHARTLVEGVIDAVARTGDGWLVVDWKNSRSSNDTWNKIRPAYEVQAQAYLSALRQRTGVDGLVTVVRLER